MAPDVELIGTFETVLEQLDPSGVVAMSTGARATKGTSCNGRC